MEYKMGMLLTCSNKDCFAQDYHKLDKDSGDVLCVACGNPVDVTQYIKTSLLAQGQIMRKPKPSIEMKCSSCGSSEGPVLLKYSKTLFKVGCKACKEVNVHLTKYFLSALKIKPDIEVIDMTSVKPECGEGVEPISKSAEGAVIVNKPITVSTKPAEIQQNKTENKVEPKISTPSASFDGLVDDGDSDVSQGRPKITVSKKDKGAAAKKAELLRQRFVDEKTGDVSEDLKASIRIDNI
jgi:hypothetical protein